MLTAKCVRYKNFIRFQVRAILKMGAKRETWLEVCGGGGLPVGGLGVLTGAPVEDLLRAPRPQALVHLGVTVHRPPRTRHPRGVWGRHPATQAR